MSTSAPRIRTAERLLAEARDLFLERNYADVTMDQIAAAAEVTKGALYHHFASKEELYLAMMHFDLAEKRELFRDAVESEGNCRQRLRRLTSDFLRLPAQRRDTILLVRRDINVFAGDVRLGLIRAYQEALPRQVQAILNVGMERHELKAADPRLLSWEYVALVETLLVPYANTVMPSVEEKLDHLIKLFFEGAAVAPTRGKEA